jgi:hypothetical protein
MKPTLFGSLVLHAERPVPVLDITDLKDLPQRSGQHVKGRYNGRWAEVNSMEPVEIYLPQRYKNLTLSTTNPNTIPQLSSGLEELDSKYTDSRQLYKLNCLLAEVNSEFAATVNIASAEQEGNPISGAFYLFSRCTPLYFALVFDVEETSVQLVWSTVDFKTHMQTRNLFRYVFFAFKPIVDRPIFIHTQSLCSRWWQFTRAFGNEKHSLLKAANALELQLYKDPNVKSYENR